MRANPGSGVISERRFISTLHPFIGDCVKMGVYISNSSYLSQNASFNSISMIMGERVNIPLSKSLSLRLETVPWGKLWVFQNISIHAAPRQGPPAPRSQTQATQRYISTRCCCSRSNIFGQKHPKTLYLASFLCL